MNSDIFLGRWKQYLARTQFAWARVRRDSTLGHRSDRDLVHARVQEHYGRARTARALRVREFERDL